MSSSDASPPPPDAVEGCLGPFFTISSRCVQRAVASGLLRRLDDHAYLPLYRCFAPAPVLLLARVLYHASSAFGGRRKRRRASAGACFSPANPPRCRVALLDSTLWRFEIIFIAKATKIDHVFAIVTIFHSYRINQAFLHFLLPRLSPPAAAARIDI